MPRYKITIEYDGTNYSGWQQQNKAPSIQEELQKALEALNKAGVKTVGFSNKEPLNTTLSTAEEDYFVSYHQMNFAFNEEQASWLAKNLHMIPKVETLDVSGCRSLEYLSASNCRISTVYLSGCTKLKSIYLVNNRLRHIDLRPFGNLIEYEANFVGNDEMESIHANINPSYSPDPDRLVVMWTTETSRHCMYMPYVYVKGKLVSQQVDLGIDLPI